MKRPQNETRIANRSRQTTRESGSRVSVSGGGGAGSEQRTLLRRHRGNSSTKLLSTSQDPHTHPTTDMTKNPKKVVQQTLLTNDKSTCLSAT